jgi:hypothetical protein
MAPGETGVLPVHPTSDGLQRHKSKSKNPRSSNSSRNDDTTRDRTSRTSTTSSSTAVSSTYGDRASRNSTTSSATAIDSAHSSRPGPNPRANSSPTLPFSKAHDLHAYNRESVASVADDPFFRNYQTPQSVSLARELRSASYSTNTHEDDTVGDTQVWKKAGASSTQAKTALHSGMENINIAVIGAAGVGKSTLIQRALGLRSLPTAVVSSLKMSVDKVVYMVSLIELELESFDFNPDSRHVQWPKQINGQIVPRMDGALILYDVMNRDSIVDLPQTLSKHINSFLH